MKTICCSLTRRKEKGIFSCEYNLDERVPAADLAPIVRSRPATTFLAHCILSSLAICLMLAGHARAANLLVYNTHDAGAGSLRQAISDNHALGGGSTILFSNVVTGTIVLTNGELNISDNVTILGPGAANLILDANQQSRVFHTSNSVVIISGVTIRNGNTGIYNNSATLTVSNCIISGCTDYGICGICSSGGYSMTVIASALTNNHKGGISNDHMALLLKASTLSGNGSASGSYGGGIVNQLASASVVGCTFSSNLGSRGCSIYSTGGLGIGDTILTADTTLAPNIYSGTQTVSSYGFNLCSDDGSGFLTAVGDQINTDPLLGPLQDNGGPTPTMKPRADSPAIDQGKSSGQTTDQRGLARRVDQASYPNAVDGDGSDIGAYEVQKDIGLRVYDGRGNYTIACEPSGGLTSPLRISKNGTTYGVLLVSTNAANASRIRIPTASGIKALMTWP
jgi:hypothetical protein